MVFLDDIRRKVSRAEGMEVSILSERFGLSSSSVTNILKGAGLYGKTLG